MGKTKKFIGKNEGTKYYVMHRSQTDATHASENEPSKFVLVKAGQTSSSELVHDMVSSNDHINEYGFKNDGYNYMQHLKPMGGGKYIGKDTGNRVIDNPIALPSDVLPGNNELKRDFNAISISQECMDEDLRRALFEDADDDGEFELLDDNFCSQVMTEPEVPDFDFDAHIASLLARSDRDAKGKIREESEDDGDSGYFDDDDGEISEVYENTITKGKIVREEDLDKLLDEEYGEDEIGGLSEEEEILGGDLDIDDADLEDALDEYLQEEKDRHLVDGGYVVAKGQRRIASLEDEESVEEVNAETIKCGVDEQIELQANAEEYLKELASNDKFPAHLNFSVNSFHRLKSAGKSVHDDDGYAIENNEADEYDIMNCQEYLREVKIEEKWDCESILSTYSTMDNHPSVIGAESFGKKKKSSKKATDSASSASNSDLIILKGKSSLPAVKTQEKSLKDANKFAKEIQALLDCQIGRSSVKLQEKKKNRDKEQQKLSTMFSVTEAINEEEDEEGADEFQKVSDDDESQVDDDDNAEFKKKQAGRMKETPEEKKLRKRQAKDLKNARKQEKREQKLAFKEESKRQISATANAQDINNISMFRY